MPVTTDKSKASSTRDFIRRMIDKSKGRTSKTKPTGPPKKGAKGRWMKLTTNPPKWKWVPDNSKSPKVKYK